MTICFIGIVVTAIGVGCGEQDDQGSLVGRLL